MPFFANAGYSGNIIGIVTHKRLQVYHALGFKTVLLHKRCFIVFNGIAYAFLVMSTCVCSPISCSASRSPVTSSASTPFSFAMRANVPSMSSAS